MSEDTFLQILIASLGGLLGASIGGVSSFILCGAVAIAGAIIPRLFPLSPITPALAWGSFFGPHVAFSAGVAAAAFASRTGRIPDGKDILTPLFKLHSPAVFTVGVVFGVGGYVMKSAFDSLPPLGGLPILNSIAASIAVSGILARIAFGKPEIEASPNLVPKQWHPWPFSRLNLWLAMTCLAVASSLIGWLYPELLGLTTAVAALSIIAVLFGAKLPIWIHAAWAGEYGAAITHDPAVGLAFALFAALVAEGIARKFLNWGETHIDPPASALAVLSPVFALVHLVAVGGGIGVFPLALSALLFLIGMLIFIKEDQSEAVKAATPADVKIR